MSKKALVAAMKAVKFPAALVEKFEAVEGEDLTTLMAALGEHVGEQEKTIATLQPLADMGDEYLKDLRTQAVAWYVKAHQADKDSPVSTEMFSKLLDRCKDDAPLLKDIIEEQRSICQSKFPEATRRSTFEKDPNEVEPPVAPPQVVATQGGERTVVERIHR